LFEGVHLSFNPTSWSVIAFVAVLAFSVFVYRRTFPVLPLRKRSVLVLLRALSLTALVALLLNPKVTLSRKETREPVVAILLDNSRSMSIEDCREGSRESEAVKIAERLSKLLRSRSARPYIFTFSSKVSQVPVALDSVITPDGEGTDIWGAVLEAASRYRGENLNSIVLLSDGRVTGGVIESDRSPGVPVYTIGVGDTLEGPDVLVEDVTCPRRSYVGMEEVITASIRGVGFKDSTVVVELVDGRNVIDRNGDNQKQDLMLKFQAKKEGEYDLVVRVSPLPSEKFGENNSQSFRLSVLKSKVKILYIDSHPDWNVTFLRSLAERSNRFWMDFIVWVPARGYIALDSRKSWSFPSSLQELSHYDLICFSDDEEILKYRENVDLLTSYINEGGSLLLLADEHSPVLRSVFLKRLEPIVPIVGVTTPGVKVSEYYPVKSGDTFNPLGSMIMENLEPGSIPPIPCIIRGIGVKSAAEVPVNLSDSSEEFPFLILQDIGEGVSCFINGFPLWRWKINPSSNTSFYDFFFGVLIQYLTEGHRKQFVEIATDRTVYRAGERIRVKVFLHSNLFQSGVEGQLWVKGEGGRRLVDRFSFDPADVNRGELEKMIGPLPPGDYQVVASVGSKDGSVPESEADISVLPQSIEFFRSSMDVELLQYIAGSTGGRMLDGSEVEDFFYRMQLRSTVVERRGVIFLLNSILPFMVIVLLLSFEWVIRKVWGLV